MDSINGVSCCSSLTPIQRILSSCPSLTPFMAKWTLRWNLIRGSEIAPGLGARLARPFGCLLKVFHSIILGRIKTQLTRECWLLLVSGSGYVSVSGSRSASVCVSLSWQWGLRPGAVTASKEVGKGEGGSTVSLAGHKVSEESQNHCKCWTNLALHARGWRVLLSKTSFVWGRGRERMRRGESGRGESRKWEVAAGCLRVLDTPSTLHFLIKFLYCKCKMNLAHSHMSSPCLKVVTATGGWTQGQAEWLTLVSCCGLPMALACLRFYSPATAVSCILSLPFSLSFRRAVSFIVPSIVANCKAAKLHSFVFLFRLGLDDSPLRRCCCCGCQQVTMVVAPCRCALRVGKLLLQYPSLPSLVQLLLRSHGLPLITTSNWFVSRSLACPSPLLASQVCH